MTDVSQYKSSPQVIIRATASGSTILDVNTASVVYFQLEMKSNALLRVSFWAYNGLIDDNGDKQYANITKSIYDATNFKYNEASFTVDSDKTRDLLLHLYECRYEEIKIKYEWSGAPIATDYLIVAARKA